MPTPENDRLELHRELKNERVLLDPFEPADFKLLRAEVRAFAAAMNQGRGREKDVPRMYCSGLIDKAKAAKNRRQFKNTTALVVSIGGTRTHIRALEIKNAKIMPRNDLAGNKTFVSEMPTPCQDYRPHALEHLLAPVVANLVPWLRALFHETKNPTSCSTGDFPRRRS